MQPQSDTDYQRLLSEVIKKQIVILGPDITLAKARNVKELTISDDGTVTSITGSPQAVTQKLIEQFMELSGLIVKKTMEPLLANYPDGVQGVAPTMDIPSPVTQAPAAPVTPAPAPMPQPAISNTPTAVAPAPAPVATPAPMPAPVATPAPISPAPTMPTPEPSLPPMPAIPGVSEAPTIETPTPEVIKAV